MHPRPRLILSLVALAAASGMLAGCAPSAPIESAVTSSPTSSPALSPSATPEIQAVVISLDGASVDGGALVPFGDVDGLVAAFTDLFGTAPDESTVDGPYDSAYTAYEWASVRVLVADARATVTVSAEAPGVAFTTEQGITLGSVRAEALAAGAEDDWDENGDGIADYLRIGMREVPGTQSLTTPGAVGIEYLTLKITDDVVSSISTGGNDFSDI